MGKIVCTEQLGELTKSALEMSTVTEAKQHQKKALQWARRAVSLNRNQFTLFNLAKVCANNGRKKEALKYAEEAMEFDITDEEFDLIYNLIISLED